MGWEKRGNRSYFYTKEREGGKVISKYIGGDSSEIAELIELSQEWRRDERERHLHLRNRERAEENVIDEQLDELSEINKNLVDALFLLNGYHQHKRQWRKKRIKSDEQHSS